MSVTEKAIEAAFNDFVRTHPAFVEFNTRPNLELMSKYVIAQWGDSGAEASPASWEIAWFALKDRLTPSDTYVPQSFRDEVAEMPGATVKYRYHQDPQFRILWDRYSKEPAALAADDPYKNLTAQEYHSIPAAMCAQKYAREPLFRAAVEKLIQRGLI